MLFSTSFSILRSRRLSIASSRYLMTSLILAATVSLTACGHKDHWQTVTNDAGHYVASFPGDVTSDTQSVDVNGSSLSMQTHTATAVDGVTFAVGSVTLPNDEPALQQAAMDSLAGDLARNAGRPAPSVPVQMKDTQGAALTGHEWRSEGTIPGTGQHRVVIARFVSKGAIAYEAVIVGEKAPSTQVADKFFQDFKPQ